MEGWGTAPLRELARRRRMTCHQCAMSVSTQAIVTSEAHTVCTTVPSAWHGIYYQDRPAALTPSQVTRHQGGQEGVFRNAPIACRDNCHRHRSMPAAVTSPCGHGTLARYWLFSSPVMSRKWVPNARKMSPILAQMGPKCAENVAHSRAFRPLQREIFRAPQPQMRDEERDFPRSVTRDARHFFALRDPKCATAKRASVTPPADTIATHNTRQARHHQATQPTPTPADQQPSLNWHHGSGDPPRAGTY